MTRLGRSRRSRDSGFQWLIIGIVLGMGCSFSFGLALYVTGYIDVSTTDEATATADVAAVASEAPDETSTTEALNTDGQTGVDAETTTDEADDDQTDLASSTQESAPPPPGNTSPTPLPGSSSLPESGTGLSTETPSTPVSVTEQDSTAISLPDGDQIPEPLAFIVSPLVNVEDGTFRMGTTQDEGQSAVSECSTRDGGNCDISDVADSIPPHEVTLDPYRIEQFEVSVSQYVAFLNYLVDQNPGSRPHLSECNGPCILTRSDTGGEFSDVIYDTDTQRYIVAPAGVDRSSYPMTYVLWEGAQAYCRAIGRRLPTEAEWEHAARGPNNTIYPWGQQWDPTAANTSRSGADRGGYGGTVPVDEFPNGVSAYSVLNMAGNVAEWTSDYYSPVIYQERANSGQAVINPTGAAFGETRVVRGGTWDAVPLFSRTVHRRFWSPGEGGPWLGFRCVDDPDPLAAPLSTTNTSTNSTNSNTAPTQPTANVPTLQPTLDPNQ